jgi:hypothetical protein
MIPTLCEHAASQNVATVVIDEEGSECPCGARETLAQMAVFKDQKPPAAMLKAFPSTEMKVYTYGTDRINVRKYTAGAGGAKSKIMRVDFDGPDAALVAFAASPQGSIPGFWSDTKLLKSCLNKVIVDANAEFGDAGRAIYCGIPIPAVESEKERPKTGNWFTKAARKTFSWWWPKAEPTIIKTISLASMIKTFYPARIYLSGRSRGGALASVVALLIAADQEHLRKEIVPIYLVTTGEPRSVRGDELSIYGISRVQKWRFVYKSDAVPVLAGMEYKHWGTAYYHTGVRLIKKGHEFPVGQQPPQPGAGESLPADDHRAMWWYFREAGKQAKLFSPCDAVAP